MGKKIMLTTHQISRILHLYGGCAPARHPWRESRTRQTGRGKKMDCVSDFFDDLFELLWNMLVDWINDLINPPAEG